MTTADKQRIAELESENSRLSDSVDNTRFWGAIACVFFLFFLGMMVNSPPKDNQICLPEKTQFFSSLDGRFAGVVLNMSDPKEAYIAKQFQQVIVNLNKIQLVPQYTSNQQPQGGAP